MPSAHANGPVTRRHLWFIFGLFYLLATSALQPSCLAQANDATSHQVFRVAYSRLKNIPLAMDAPTFRNIYAVNTEGRGEETLTHDNHSFSPVFSPDGSRIAYIHIKSETCEGCLFHAEYELYVMNADGSDPRFVAPLEGPLSQIHWSPDSKAISYRGWGKRNPKEPLLSGLPIYLAKLDGPAASVQLIQGVIGAFEWSPDGKWIVHGCVAHLTPSPQAGLCLTNVGAPENPTVLSNGSLPFCFAWSPDSTRIAFVVGDKKSDSIFVAETDGSPPKALTGISWTFSKPQWSPDSQRILFDDIEGSKSAIFLINAEGSARLSLTEPKLRASNPAWSPDGRQIAFSAVVKGRAQVHLINADGSSLRQVTHDKKTRCSAYSWLPNGKFLLLSCGSVNHAVDFAPLHQNLQLSLLDLDDQTVSPRQLANDVQGPISFAPVQRSQTTANP
jgi:Tol biopolymer transport system component